MVKNILSPPFAQLVQDFFCQRLMAQRNASRHTIASYRDTFRLLLRYVERRQTGKCPAILTLHDLDASVVLAFLEYTEKERGNSVRSRNVRLAAIHSFMRYASFRDPANLSDIQGVLAIPVKRFDRPLVGFLSREEIQAIIAAPDQSTWSGKRDHALLATLYNTGARVSEIINSSVADLTLSPDTSFILLHGKGRKQRTVPLWKNTSALLKRWLPQIVSTAQSPLFPARSGARLSRSSVEKRLRAAVQTATACCPALQDRVVSPHLIRHTTAMHLLQAGVDITVIALWLGHESPATTHHYVEADLKMKERALSSLQPVELKKTRYQATDRLLQFLDNL